MAFVAPALRGRLLPTAVSAVATDWTTAANDSSADGRATRSTAVIVTNSAMPGRR